MVIPKSATICGLVLRIFAVSAWCPARYSAGLSWLLLRLERLMIFVSPSPNSGIRQSSR